MLIHTTESKDINFLKNLVWHDAELISGVITVNNQDDFPSTICYSGHSNPNISLIYELEFTKLTLRLVFVNCDEFDFNYFIGMNTSKILINKIGAVQVLDHVGKCRIRASALLYEIIS